MEKKVVFPYYWMIDEKEEEITSIRVYCLDEKDRNICITVNDFTPYVYIELPTNYKWTDSLAQVLANNIDEHMKRFKPLKKQLLFKHRLYGAHLNSDGSRKKFPYLFCAFSNRNDITKLFFYIRKPINVPGIGIMNLKIHEKNADPILQLITVRDIPSVGWISCVGKKVPNVEKVTLCHEEYVVKYKSLTRQNIETVARPKIMGFDIEVNSTITSAMPKSKIPGDKIFQISCVFVRDGSEELNSHLITLGQPDQKLVGEDITLHPCETESEILQTFTKLVRTENPNIIVGYNILGFDIQYMIERSQFPCNCFGSFSKLGFHKFLNSPEKTINWSSNAFKNQEFKYLDAEGRIFVDLLPLIKRDFRFDNYKLKTVATNLLGSSKDPLTPKGIFKCYRIGTKKLSDGSYSQKAVEAISMCAKYCVQDTVLCMKLIHKLQTFTGLAEMAKTWSVGIFSIFTQGQQIKVFSQVYRHAYEHNIVVEQDGYVTKDDERYVGAHVFPPVPGLYERVLPFDFASLYPTTIIAYNIDYHTYVTDPNIPDSMCHVMHWFDHVNCLGENSIITINGFGIPIQNLIKNKRLVLSHSEISNKLEYKSQNNWFNQGEKECVEITFIDGSTLICTPDHKIMTSTNDWVVAKDLVINKTKIKKGISYPSTNFEEYISDFSIECGKLKLSMKTCDEVEKFSKFCRIFGFLYTDGTFAKNRATCFVGDLVDAQCLVDDIFSICGEIIEPKFTNNGISSLFNVRIPYSIHNSFMWKLGDGYGKRMEKNSHLPSFILKKNCPKILKREFLAGMFGGDGLAPGYCKSTKNYTTSGLCASKTKEKLENLKDFFESIQKILLDDFNIGSYINGPYNQKSNPMCYTSTICIDVNDLIKFHEKIGYRYCTYKMIKLEILCSYKRLINNVFDQRQRCFEMIHMMKSEMTWDEAIKKAHSTLRESEPIFNEHYAFPNKMAAIDAVRRPRNGNKKTFWSNNFPSFESYIVDLGVYDMFVNNKIEKASSIYGMNQQKLDDIPYYLMKILSIKSIGKQKVYDIEVQDNHSFLANGCVVHNCVHDPKIIRKLELTKYIEEEKKVIKALREERDKRSNKNRRDEIVAKLQTKVEELTPYIKERSNIMKTIGKNVMCAERYYRFLKEPKGVIPTILQNLLDARKNTRSTIKENKKEIERLLLTNTEEDQIKIADLKILNNMLEKRQLAYKVSANSVSATTPIPCKIDGVFVYKTIEELSSGDWIRINDEQEVSKPIKNLEVWSDKGFTNVKFVMRHPKTENLFRVNTHIGCVDCTGDHSLLRNDCVEVKPKELNINDELLHNEYPLPSDTPKKPLFTEISDDTIDKYLLNTSDEKKAFAHGLFFAEGTCGKWGVLEKAKTSWIIYNQNIKLLEKCRDILNEVEDVEFEISRYYESARVYHLVPKKHIVEITNEYRSMFYDNRKFKRIPDYILNSNFQIRQAFFMGYYSGDGNRHLKTGVVIQNKGSIGTASLFYLAKSIGYKVSISYCKNENKELIYRLQCCVGFRNNNINAIKTIEIMKNNEPKYIESLQEKIIRNNEEIKHKNNVSTYRNITIFCERFPRQKLLDSLDNAILCAEQRNSYISEYDTKTKKIKYRKYCCDKEYIISLRVLNKKLPECFNLCSCDFKNDIKNKNDINVYEEKQYIEYVYDIETENHHFAAGIGNMIVHNSMYGAMGVKKGYLPFMPGAMCLCADSQISFSYGFTRKIKDLVDTNNLWSYNDGQIVSNGNGIKYNGKRELVKITLLDGRTLRCTSDHKVMTTNGWIEAGKLISKHKWDGETFTTKSGCSQVIVGLELPEDVLGDDEKNWKILDYTMDTPNNREKTLAFCRIIGFILADGSISSYLGNNNKQTIDCTAVFGTLLDANVFVGDIKLLTEKEPKIYNSERTEIKGNTYSIHIPKSLVKKIIMLDGIPIGKRSHQPYTLPEFLFENGCPLSVIREFLGGLFGGDGTSPSLSKSHPSFAPIQLGLTTIEKYKDDMENTMNNLVYLLAKFDLKFWCATPRLARVRERLLAKDIKENPRWEYMITSNSCSNLLFAQKIGFRYCSDKNNKLAISASYQRYSDSVRKQHINIVLTASNMYDSNRGKFSMKHILSKARKEVYENECPLNGYASLAKPTDIYNHRSREHSLENFRLLKTFFPTAREYTKMSCCEHWFSEQQSSNKIYSLERKSTVSPCFYLDVVDVRYDGIDDVYDIVDMPYHSILSNGIVVHNCTTFKGRENIELVAKTIPEKYGGELVYGDTDTGKQSEKDNLHKISI